jgi:hypothetical protein
MAPPHTHPSTPSQTPKTLQRVNAALQKEKAGWQKSIAEQEERIAGLRKEKERLVSPPSSSLPAHDVKCQFELLIFFVPQEKLEQSGALVFPATATSEELVVTDPKIIQMVHDHIKKGIKEGRVREEHIIRDQKLIDERLGRNQS